MYGRLCVPLFVLIVVLIFARKVLFSQATKVCKMESEIPLHAWLPCMTGTSQGAFFVTPEILYGDISYIRTKVRVTKSEISMRTWRSPMSAASKDAFVVIPEISHSDISYIIKKEHSTVSDKMS